MVVVKSTPSGLLQKVMVFLSGLNLSHSLKCRYDKVSEQIYQPYMINRKPSIWERSRGRKL